MTTVTEAMKIWIAGVEYRATLIGGSPDGERFVRLERGGARPAAYDVWLDLHGARAAGEQAHGLYRCNCPDYTYRREGLTALPCKHGRRIMELGLLDPEPSRLDDRKD